MPLYRLRRLLDDKTFEKDARDDEHALAVFGQKLRVTLTFEGPAAPQYMMGHIGKTVNWTKPLDISVWEVR